MVKVKPFIGIRPPANIVEKVASRPYDVLSSDEARVEAKDNDMSLYHIIKPEIDFPVEVNETDSCVYAKAVENFNKFISNGWLKKDDKSMYYLYAITMNGHTQNGIVLCASIYDYLSGSIKKHELTRKDKEEDRMRHIQNTDANVEPVFLAYPDNEILNGLMKKYSENKTEYDFVAPDDGFRHQFWLIDNDEDIDLITRIFAEMPSMYIADGHHRSSAAVKLGYEKSSGNECSDVESDYFLAVCFPQSELTILDYNRVIKDLAGLSVFDFISRLESHFTVERVGKNAVRPAHTHEISMYLDGEWYRLELKPEYVCDDDPIEALDVTVTSRYILDEILGIKDLRTDKRIDFVGGLRGLRELERRCDSGEMRLALALYPVTMKQIVEIADKGLIMPPKATWFEPKLRSGLVVHKLS